MTEHISVYLCIALSHFVPMIFSSFGWCSERRASTMEEDTAKKNDDVNESDKMDIEDAHDKKGKGKRRSQASSKAKTSYGVTEGKQWFQMFPAITKRKKNHIKKKKGAVRG